MREDAGFEKLFIVGCPRSGTTWVQLLLSQFAEIATAPETQIFAFYLDHFQRQWRHEHEGPGHAYRGNAGLSRLLSEEEFEELCRLNAQLVLGKIAARNPAARIVVEKSPQHALHAAFIRRILPDARFLHVVRDPRDAAASLLAAGRSWGRGWAPKNAIGAARTWLRHFEGARTLAGDPQRYREIRYEALRQDAAAELRETLAWLGVPKGADECEAAARACELGRLKGAARGPDLPVPGERSPQGFFRKGAVGGWRSELSRGQVGVIERICRNAMLDCGYVPATNGRTASAVRILAHDAIQRIREGVDWKLQQLLESI